VQHEQINIYTCIQTYINIFNTHIINYFVREKTQGAEMTVMKTIYLNPLEKVINFSRTQCGKETTYRPFFYITVSQIIVRYISNSKVVTSGA
jgi:hypothetical protein